MKVFLIIIGLIFGVIVLYILAVNHFHRKAAQKARTIDPLDYLSPNMFMGIEIGDEWEFVLSRMHHVGLISGRSLGLQKYDYINDNQLYFTFESTAKDFENITSASFEIINGKLSGISVHLQAASKQEMEKLKKNLLERYTLRFGSPKKVKAGYAFGEQDGATLIVGAINDDLTIGLPWECL